MWEILGLLGRMTVSHATHGLQPPQTGVFFGEVLGRIGAFLGADDVLSIKKPDFSGFFMSALLILVDIYTSFFG